MSKSRSHKNAVRILIAIALAAGFFDPRREAEASAISADLFAEQVAPIFAARCIACHGARVQRGGLDLRTEEAARRGGARGPAIVPGRSAESLLYRLITHQAEPAMPMGLDRLKDSEIAAIARWIDTSTGPPPAAPPVTPVREPGAPITKEDRAFWSFRPIVRAALPEVRNRAWVRNAIDAFVLRRLEENQLAPAPPADPRTLLRRVYFDLTGLPPSPDEIAGFVKDPSDAAYEQVIERLLASPHYGERWGRHWLDLARYADSGGYEFDIDRPHAWRYRDWVIKAFNDDLPYDRFIREQLAGDQLHPGDAAALIPTGFCRNGPTVDNANNEETRTDELDDMVTTTSAVFLGLTVGCARCHDHKYDPIPQRDYYRLQAVFFPFKKTDQLMVSQTEADAFKSRQREIDAQVKPLKEGIAEIEGPVRARLLAEKVEFHVRLAESSGALAGRTREQLRAETAARFAKDVQLQAEEIEALLTPEALGERKRLLTEIEQINQTRPRPLPAAMGITDREDPGQAHLLLRGDWRSKGEKVGPGLPAALADGTDAKDLASRDRRRQLADWIARAENPLTARVAVNRIWQYHFGQGIVRTPSDFGATGDRPSHPELLDYLATEFIARGWSWKAMHRLILTSNAYRQSSRYDAAASARDPENRWLWRSHPRRIEAEAIRDSILVASGKLNREMGGPGIYPRIDPAVINTGSRPRWPLEAREGPEVWRRSVYIFVKRSVLLPLLEVYDCPVTTVSAPVRAASTVSPQALALLNNEFVLEQARFFAWRVLSEAGAGRSAQINRAFSIALGRAPSAREAEWSLEFLNRQSGLYGARRQAEAPTAALRDLCHALFNLNEFVYLD
jgi:mono/diheme cytochrome c family protein